MTFIPSEKIMPTMGKSTKELEEIYANFQKNVKKNYENIFEEKIPIQLSLDEILDLILDSEDNLLQKVTALINLKKEHGIKLLIKNKHV